jgi:bifunctional NMN adenylyltransferase/nudix hydrolase
MIKVGLMLGRFQGVTLGHEACVNTMVNECDIALIGVGSAHQARDPRNPWTFEERREMWVQSLTKEKLKKVFLFDQVDLGNPVRWASAVEARVTRELAKLGYNADKVDIYLYGHRKDATSYYLDDFPNYILKNLPNVEGINASDFREDYFRHGDDNTWYVTIKDIVSEGVIRFLKSFREREAYDQMKEEVSRNDNWAKTYKDLPHEVIFCDALPVIIQGNRVLLTKREQYPGKGYWGLPEGRIKEKEDPVEACIRIAREKTDLDVSDSVLKRSLKSSWTRTDPYRVSRGRVIAFPSVIHLTPVPKGATPEARRKSMALPRVKKNSQYFTFDEVFQMRSEIYADHAIIIDQALERLGIRLD